ncbi:phosphoglycerol geranylgeranyltransferase [Salegentibacter maritimus]|uniref:geranylgeranylglyceryl/heptaprenylglyceryl phosphate synthase n=1 Tax=Salegentibacter maritimus TaxID=2794347 RepID=UPI0018E4D77C|nr:geranylgeranylglyceryl/heptaprenylglyceryl phosphate synthase [Salegentibacter maritimus]MBI6117163.1 geranylgeranylglyceryl/heptaprenylglyceryl phosphate synthase [Salegentibacter maritimus]
MPNFYAEISRASTKGEKLLAILIDPDKFKEPEAEAYLKRIPKETSHIFVGGSSVAKCKTEKTVNSIKKHTNLPVILFPGDYSQITETADALLFLSLLSGRNPEYLIEQQIKSVKNLRNSSLQIIPTAYILIDGGKECAVQRISKTKPIPQFQVEAIVDTALAGEFSGKKLIYLEAGSGADFPVSEEIISKVKKAISIPLIVGGGIRSRVQQNSAYKAGADMIVMGTQFEK